MQLQQVDNEAWSWEGIIRSLIASTGASYADPEPPRNSTRHRISIRIQSSTPTGAGSQTGSEVATSAASTSGEVPPPAASIDSMEAAAPRTSTGSGQLTRRVQSATTIPAATDETTAASAERHRLTGGRVMDIQAAGNWLEHTVPFMFLLGWIFVLDHLAELCLTIWLGAAIARTNSSIRKQISLRKDYQVQELLGALIYVTGNSILVLWLTGANHMGLVKMMALQPVEQNFSAWGNLLSIVFLDSLVRFIATVPKLLVVLLFQSKWHSPRHTRQQARLLTMVEYALLLYRSLLPVRMWYCYFVAYTGGRILASVFAGSYLTMKAVQVWSRGELLLLSFRMVFRKGAVYGAYAHKDDLNETGNQCPICQDAVATGIKLECGHIYCEECISEWLERDRTCPMCRAPIKPPGLQSYGDGSTSLMPQVF